MQPHAYGGLIKHGLDPLASDSYVLPVLQDAAVRRDATKVMRAASQAEIQAAGETLMAGFGKPVLLVWSDEDRFFPLASAQRYAASLRVAQLALLTDAYSFTPEDQPGRFAELLAEFVCRPARDPFA